MGQMAKVTHNIHHKSFHPKQLNQSKRNKSQPTHQNVFIFKEDLKGVDQLFNDNSLLHLCVILVLPLLFVFICYYFICLFVS